MKEQHAAVIGHPIGHTMSPFLQRRLFALSGIPMAYQVLDVPELSAALPELRALDCFNVTIPHKTAILPFLSGMDAKAAACGSVNTVRVQNGELYGATTDGEGCRLALARHGLELSGELALLGNGGAARGILFEIVSQPGRKAVTLVCRPESREKAGALCREAGSFAAAQERDCRLRVCTYDELEAERERVYDLLLNATSVGMYPNAGASPVTEAVLSRCRAVFDAVFNPRETELLRLAKGCGAQTVEGIDMLVYQAAASHRYWYGTEFPAAELDRLCRDAGAETDRLFLTR